MKIKLLIPFLILVSLAVPCMAETQSVEKQMEIVSSPVVTADPVTTFLNLYSYLQRDLGEGGIIVLDNETMALITATGTTHTPTSFFGRTFPDNTMTGYIPDVPADFATAIVAMVPDSKHAIEALKPYVADGRHVFLFIGMRLENVPDDTVIKPLDVFWIEDAMRERFDHRGLDADTAFSVLCNDMGFENNDELILYVIKDPSQFESLIARASSLMYPRQNTSTASVMLVVGVTLFLAVVIIAVSALGLWIARDGRAKKAVSSWIEEKKSGREKSSEEKKKDDK